MSYFFSNRNYGTNALVVNKSHKPRLSNMRPIMALLLALACVNFPSQVLADSESDFQISNRQYIQKVAFLFRQNLNIKSVHMDNPVVIVRLSFKPDGKFETVQIEEGSGDPSFDMAVEYALLRSIPSIPAPPIPPSVKGSFSFSVRVCGTC